jgi:ribulose-phosphate 3-epimerase
MTFRIAPSILSADFARLADQVEQLEAGGADLLHVDVMDGHFVPNITIGPLVVASLKRVTRLPIEVHLMIQNPDRYLGAFVEAGASTVLVHVEVLPHLHRTLQEIRRLGARPGAVINPSTPVSSVAEVLEELDQLLVMSVNPGFGGQAFIPHSLQKVRDARKLLDVKDSAADVEVDGGVTSANIASLVKAGATVLVAGAAIFREADPSAAVRQLRKAAEAAR